MSINVFIGTNASTTWISRYKQYSKCVEWKENDNTYTDLNKNTTPIYKLLEQQQQQQNTVIVVHKEI